MLADEELVVFVDRDNVISLVLTTTADGKPLESMSYVTKVLVKLPGLSLSSDDHPALIWWTDTSVVKYKGVDVTVSVLKLKLGSLVTIPKGIYSNGRIILFDASNPNGVTWVRNMTVEVDIEE